MDSLITPRPVHSWRVRGISSSGASS